VMIHDRPDKLAITAPIEHDYSWEHEEEIKVTRARVNSRCQDLLAVVAPRSEQDAYTRFTPPYRVEFLHGSV
jgi:hypothetical protein